MYRIIQIVSLAFVFCATTVAAAPLRVVTTTTDLASIVRAVGGDRVQVKSLSNGIEDPHFVEAKPGFIRELARADVFVQTGMDLEVGWVPVLLQNCRNAKVLPGAAGFVDASRVIHRIYDKTGEVNRSMGDVHAAGNPHYLVDPAAGILVTNYIGERLSTISPAHAAAIQGRSQAYQRKLAIALWGSELTNQYAPVKLAGLLQKGGGAALISFLKRQGRAGSIGGWMSALSGYRGQSVLVEHRFWPYFAKTFGLNVAEALEPIAGVDPTTRHLKKVIDVAKVTRPRAILALPYFPSRHARFVSENTGVKIVKMAHMPLSRPGTTDYFSMLEYNVRALLAN